MGNITMMTNHAEKCFQKMATYFLQEQLTDVVIISGKLKIRAHRLVLCAASEYFAAMFTNNLKEASQNEVELHNVDGNALQALINYCYTGIIELGEDTIESLFVTASLLQLTDVVANCANFLRGQLHPSNCIGISTFADSIGCVELLKECQNYTAEHFLEVIKNNEFLLIPADEVYKLLASDDLNVSSEEDVFNALMLWLEYDLPQRTEHIMKLFKLVKLPFLSPSFIVDQIESVPLFRDNSECRELIFEAFKYHLLPERRSMAQWSGTCPRKSTIGDLYVFGGMDSDKSVSSMEKYNVRLDKWTSFNSKTIRSLNCCVAVFDQEVYFVGGRFGGRPVDRFECYNMKTNECRSLPQMPTARHGLGLAFLKGILYAVGGQDGRRFVSTVEKYDPQTRSWSAVKPMATQRSTFGVAVLNGQLYAVGGCDGSGCLKTVECYDPRTNEWMYCAPMMKSRGGVGVGVLHGYLYAFGGHEVPGMNPSTPRLSCVEVYDPKTDSWTTIASMSCGRDGIGVCVVGEKLFAVGGYDGEKYLSLVEAYDPRKNEWQEMSPLCRKRANACAVVIKSALKLPVNMYN